MSFLDTLFDLSGKTVVVTGGSRGLGKEMALACAAAGADIVVASRKLDACKLVTDEIERVYGRAAMPYSVHIGRWDELEPFVDAVYARFGKIDVLINNAGVSPAYDKNTDVTEQLFDSINNLNYKGPFRLTALVGERMQAAGSGSVINISSGASVRPGGDNIPYGSAKAALNTLTQGFAAAYGPEVRVNCVMSGAMLTDIVRDFYSGPDQPSIQGLPMGRIGDPKEIVGAVLYLASSASSYTTGATIRVDGGAS
ncbi:MAG: glucose 1-dehydrogenase [Actinomycetota bacterium]|nr:glucose 1-dehydrogenase [Actinomycetota bacterium]